MNHKDMKIILFWVFTRLMLLLLGSLPNSGVIMHIKYIDILFAIYIYIVTILHRKNNQDKYHILRLS